MHIFAILCLIFILGCFCGIKFDIACICVVLSFVIFAFLFKIILFKIKTKGNLYIIILLFAFVVGALMGWYHNYNTFSKVSHLYDTTVTVTGIVTEVDGKNFIVKTNDYCVSVHKYGWFEVHEGDVVRLAGKLQTFEPAQYKGDADYRYYYALKGIVGRINTNNIEITGYEDDFSIWDIGSKVRNYISVKIEDYAISHKVKGLMTALLTGNTDNLDDELREDFRLTGISHLVAVSGLHMGIFLSFFVLISARLKKNRVLHLLFILTLVVLYTIIIGERASILRAGIMAVASYLLFGMKRRSDGVMNLMIAGVMICIINPYYSMDAGFQLSFTVTLGIVLFAPHFKHKTVAVPLIAMLFVMPVAVYYYNTVSLETVLVNMIVVPMVPMIILFGYMGCVFPLFGFIAGVLSSIIIYVADFFASLDFLHITVPSPDILQFILFYLVCTAVYLLIDNFKLDEALFIFLVVSVLGVNMFVYRSIDTDYDKVKFINSGSFTMAHITTGNEKEILVDCGYKATDYAVKTGIDEIYLVLITKNRENRYEQLENLCAECKVQTILLPESMKTVNLKLENSKVLYYNQDDYTFYVDDVGFKIISEKDKTFILSVSYKSIKIPSKEDFDNTYIMQQTSGFIFKPTVVH